MSIPAFVPEATTSVSPIWLGKEGLLKKKEIEEELKGALSLTLKLILPKTP